MLKRVMKRFMVVDARSERVHGDLGNKIVYGDLQFCCRSFPRDQTLLLSEHRDPHLSQHALRNRLNIDDEALGGVRAECVPNRGIFTHEWPGLGCCGSVLYNRRTGATVGSHRRVRTQSRWLPA